MKDFLKRIFIMEVSLKLPVVSSCILKNNFAQQKDHPFL